MPNYLCLREESRLNWRRITSAGREKETSLRKGHHRKRPPNWFTCLMLGNLAVAEPCMCYVEPTFTAHCGDINHIPLTWVCVRGSRLDSWFTFICRFRLAG